jgi:hypothetical protein
VAIYQGKSGNDEVGIHVKDALESEMIDAEAQTE